MKSFCYHVVFVLVLIGLIFGTIFAFSCKLVEMYPTKDETVNIVKVCIEGHTYYDIRGDLLIKLDDDGKPEKCEK